MSRQAGPIPWHLGKTINVTLEPEEHRQFKVEAEKRGMTPGAYARSIIRDRNRQTERRT